MNSPIKKFLQKTNGLHLLLFIAFLADAQAQAAANLILWDTRSPLGLTVETKAKDSWRIVPTDLFKLEADPLKSSSDPGYYGREYSFAGDMVVENRSMTAAFSSAGGKVTLYSKKENAAGPSSDSELGDIIGEIVPLGSKDTHISKLNLLRNAGDEVVVEVFFDKPGFASVPITFEFGKTEIISIKPAAGLSGISFHAPIEYAISPSFIGDDLIYDGARTFLSASQTPETAPIAVPAENMLLGLLKGEKHQVVFTFPKTGQHVALTTRANNQDTSTFASIDIQTAGKPLFIAPQSASGIWHREGLSSAYLEKVVPSNWQRPFPARWETQLIEAGVRTRFAFRDGASTVWRGVPGSYNFPVWFDGDKAMFHLSKKVPPKGDAITYFLEGQDTPASILSPVDILKSTVGRSEADEILDLPGRKLRTHHRRGGEGVRRACTCGCTEAIQAIFEAGEEAQRKNDIHEEIDDMIYFVQSHVQRIDEYQKFAADLQTLLKINAASSPGLKNYVEALQQLVEQIPQEYEVQKENMKNLDYARELESDTMQLTDKKDPAHLAAYMELLKAWRGMGGAQDYVVAQCHALTRKLFQEATYRAATEPKAVELAMEIRSRCREVLRNADGYEIWPNY